VLQLTRQFGKVARMQSYRLYRIDKSDHVQITLNFEAKNDLVAFAQAQKMRASQTVEVWQGERRIGRIENQSSS
jgi:hypothetical protein